MTCRQLEDNAKTYNASLLETANRHAEWSGLSQEINCARDVFVNLVTHSKQA